MKTRLILMFVLVFALGCQKDKYSPGDYTKFNLTDAKALFITEKDNKLFKITNDGEVKEVTIIDVSGNEITRSPLDLINLSDGNIILVYGTDDAYFVRLSDGKAFGFREHTPKDRIYEQSYAGEKVSKVGDNSYIYITNSYDGGRLVKLNAANPENITFDILSESSDALIAFIADIYGNIAYEAWFEDLKFRSVNGEFKTLPGETNTSTDFWTSMNDDSLFYFNTTLIDNANGDVGVRKVIPSPFEVVNYGNTNMNNSCGLVNVLKIKNKNRVALVGGCQGINYLEDFENSGHEIMYKVDIPVEYVNLAYCSDNYYYVFGVDGADKSMMLKINPDDNSYEQLINGEYEIIKMDARSNDEVLFSGIRASDNKIVIGEINASGTINILSENIENKALVFEAL